jgi:hypothetical protein
MRRGQLYRVIYAYKGVQHWGGEYRSREQAREEMLDLREAGFSVRLQRV